MLEHLPRPDRVSFLKQLFKAPFDDKAVEKSRRKLARALARMDTTLAREPWLAGDSYSLADIAAAPVVDRIERLGMADLWRDLKGVRDWIERLKARPAYAKALPREEFRMPAPAAG